MEENQTPTQVLSASWFCRPATELAPSLLGKILCRRTEDGVLSFRITETECYFGEEDTACHAHRGRTPRTEVMYRAGGCAYVYLCYGMHSMLNLVTGPEGHPEAVLIRGVENIVGPGRVTKQMKIDRACNGMLLTPDNGLWIEDDGITLDFTTTPRVGIDYASREYREIAWRFVAYKK